MFIDRLLPLINAGSLLPMMLSWLHGDMNLDNIIVPIVHDTQTKLRSLCGPTLTFIDWDKAGYGMAAYEYAQFLSSVKRYQQQWPIEEALYQGALTAFREGYDGFCADDDDIMYQYATIYWQLKEQVGNTEQGVLHEQPPPLRDL